MNDSDLIEALKEALNCKNDQIRELSSIITKLSIDKARLIERVQELEIDRVRHGWEMM